MGSYLFSLTDFLAEQWGTSGVSGADETNGVAGDPSMCCHSNDDI